MILSYTILCMQYTLHFSFMFEVHVNVVMPIIILKALCHDIRRNCFLMSSLVQKLKWVQEVWQYYGIVYGSS